MARYSPFVEPLGVLGSMVESAASVPGGGGVRTRILSAFFLASSNDKSVGACMAESISKLAIKRITNTHAVQTSARKKSSVPDGIPRKKCSFFAPVRTWP
jgi:hypothetical protein